MLHLVVHVRAFHFFPPHHSLVKRLIIYDLSWASWTRSRVHRLARIRIGLTAVLTGPSTRVASYRSGPMLHRSSSGFRQKWLILIFLELMTIRQLWRQLSKSRSCKSAEGQRVLNYKVVSFIMFINLAQKRYRWLNNVNSIDDSSSIREKVFPFFAIFFPLIIFQNHAKYKSFDLRLKIHDWNHSRQMWHWFWVSWLFSDCFFQRLTKEPLKFGH